MHNAWWWNNAVDAPFCAQTAVRQSLWGPAWCCGSVKPPVDEWRAWRMSRATRHINESLHLTFCRHVFEQTCPSRLEDLMKWHVWHLSARRARARVCVCDLTGWKEQQGRRRGGFFIFHIFTSWYQRRVSYLLLFQVSTRWRDDRSGVPNLKVQQRIWYNLNIYCTFLTYV